MIYNNEGVESHVYFFSSGGEGVGERQVLNNMNKKDPFYILKINIYLIFNSKDTCLDNILLGIDRCIFYFLFISLLLVALQSLK